MLNRMGKITILLPVLSIDYTVCKKVMIKLIYYIEESNDYFIEKNWLHKECYSHLEKCLLHWGSNDYLEKSWVHMKCYSHLEKYLLHWGK